MKKKTDLEEFLLKGGKIEKLPLGYADKPASDSRYKRYGDRNGKQWTSDAFSYAQRMIYRRKNT